MERLVPVFYGNYGKYISRFRAIPYHIDIFRPVERRMLLSLYDVARNKFVKSAKVVGHCMGNYHPHAEAYGTLVRLVKTGFAIGQGNWGSIGLEEDPPAAMRYTEVKLDPKFEELAFKYIKYVPWKEYEFALEPEYLPSPIPLGLVGNTGVNQGIAFHRTSIPTFTIQDLFYALYIVLGIEKNEEFKLLPYLIGHEIIEYDYNYYYTGKGYVTFRPIVVQGKDKKQVELRGVPQSKSKFYKFIENNNLEIYDYTSKDIKIVIKGNRKIDLQKLDQAISNKISYDILLVDEAGHVFRKSVEKIIIDTYESYKNAYANFLNDSIQKLEERISELMIIKKIKEVLRKKSINSIEELHKSIPDVPLDRLKQITDKYSIRRLVNIEVNIPQVTMEKEETEKRLNFLNRSIKQEIKKVAKSFV